MYGINEIHSLPDTFENIFRASCVTYTETCKVLPVYAVINKSLLVQNDNTKLTEEDILGIRNMLPVNLLRIYDIMRVVGRMLLLKRKMKSHCTLCNRAHDNENAFLTVSDEWNIYFHCRREQNKSLFIGFLKENSDAKKIAERQLAVIKERLEKDQGSVAKNALSDEQIQHMRQRIQMDTSTKNTIPNNQIQNIRQQLQINSTTLSNHNTPSYFQTNNELPFFMATKSKHQMLRQMSAASK